MDFLTDKNLQFLHSLTSVVNPPEFVKQAMEVDTEAIEKLPDTAFANATHREYPCHTKEACWTSYLYWQGAPRRQLDKCAELSIDLNFNKFIDFWNLEKEANEMLSSFEKKSEELTPDKYAIVTNVKGTTYKLYPIHDDVSVKTSSATFMHSHSNYPYSTRKLCAAKILDASKKHNVCLPEDEVSYLQKAAGIGIGEPIKIKKEINNRIALAKKINRSNNEIYEKLADTVTHIVNKDYCLPEQMSKLAQAIDLFDAATGVDSYYSDIASPEEVCFTTTLNDMEKVAAEVAHSVTLSNGVSFKLAELIKAGKDLFDVVDSNLWNDVAGNDMEVKLAEILPTLPRDDAELITRLAPEFNIKGF